jgi:carbon storage regulator
MLVLSRKAGQRIVVGPNIVVTVLDVRGERVKLGFDAPGEVAIHREEVRRRLDREEHCQGPPWRPAESRFFAEFA